MARILTIPNVLSFIRLLLIPVFLVLLVIGEYGYALLILVVSSVTDFVDGYVARRFNQVSRLGQLLDPAVDRLFIFSTLIGLAWQEVVPVVAGRGHRRARSAAARDRRGARQLRLRAAARAPPRQGRDLRPAVRPAASSCSAVAFPELASVANPVGWAAAIWGAFLYWWAGIVYLRESLSD